MRSSFFLMLLFFVLKAESSNIKIRELEIIDENKISFLFSWDNSWSDSIIGNHDAAWVFLKYRTNSGNWMHLDLSNQNSDHSSTYFTIESVSDGKGVFIKGPENFNGDLSENKITVKSKGPLPWGFYDLQIFAVEMAFVPPGAFTIGDGKSINTLGKKGNLLPYKINSQNAIPVNQDAESLAIPDTNDLISQVPSTFPNGFNGFYCMKYEISQEQYSAFLNTLNFNQQNSRTAVSANSASGTRAMTSTAAARNSIVIKEPGNSNSSAVYAHQANSDNIFNAAEDGQNRACNFLSWADVSAYLDWAALRPITETEFEKVARGPNEAVELEFAWGTAYINDANTIINEGTENESVTETANDSAGLGAVGYTGPLGPLRNGFAAKENSTRIQSGAGYYGVFELSGNLWETTVTLNNTGIKLTSSDNGDGNLDGNGFANVINWPSANSIGIIYRGGGWLSGVSQSFRDPAVSDRFYMGWKADVRKNTSSGRGVRSF